jgi:hypothetical protein
MLRVWGRAHSLVSADNWPQDFPAKSDAARL